MASWGGAPLASLLKQGEAEERVPYKLMRGIVLLAVAVGGATLLARSLRAQEKPLDVVPQVDFERYAGTWFEIARLPNRFEEDCASDVRATYTPRPDGRITVVNRCVEKDGRVNEAEGVARQVDGKPPSVLKVRFAPRWLSFLPMVWGDYNIIELAPDYTHAIVGSPDRKYLWFLAREPKLDPGTYQRLVDRAKAQGFDVSRLIRTEQTGG
jgi:apolipoprotein D and lipocalin family protein